MHDHRRSTTKLVAIVLFIVLGGFASADRPEAHFGLGGARKVGSVEVLWRDGSKTVLKGPIPPNSELTVRRAK